MWPPDDETEHCSATNSSHGMIGAVIQLQAPVRQDCLFGPSWIGYLRTVIHLNVYILVISAYTDKQSKITRT